jgi:hypothetical protein
MPQTGFVTWEENSGKKLLNWIILGKAHGKRLGRTVLQKLLGRK